MNPHDFLIALLVFLAARWWRCRWARRFGLGAVLGYLLAVPPSGPGPCAW